MTLLAFMGKGWKIKENYGDMVQVADSKSLEKLYISSCMEDPKIEVLSEFQTSFFYISICTVKKFEIM